MKTSTRLLVTALVSALIIPLSAEAAKGERKKNQNHEGDFAAMDKDGDGYVSQAEYLAAMKDQGTEEAAKKRFAALDKDHDGKLTKE